MRIRTVESISTQFNENENTEANREAFIKEYPLTDFTYEEDRDAYDFNISILRFYFRGQSIAEWHSDEDFGWLKETEPPWDIILLNLYNTLPYNPKVVNRSWKFDMTYGPDNIITREKFSRLTKKEQENLVMFVMDHLYGKLEKRRRR